MRESGCAELVKTVLDDSIPMYGRMVHGRDSKGGLFEQSQQYDIYKRVRRLVAYLSLTPPLKHS
jgi:kynurenine 3-monooxygenase